MQLRTIKKQLLKNFSMRSLKGKFTKSYLKEEHSHFTFSSRSRFKSVIVLFTFVTIVRKILTGQSLVDFHFLGEKRNIGITNTVVRQIKIVESLVDFDCVSNIDVALESLRSLRDNFKLVKVFMTLIASAIDVAPVESQNVIKSYIRLRIYEGHIFELRIKT